MELIRATHRVGSVAKMKHRKVKDSVIPLDIESISQITSVHKKCTNKIFALLISKSGLCNLTSATIMAALPGAYVRLNWSSWKKTADRN